jgi:uncharacterized membrane protein YdjX (TVP38/TMEM64 family)
MAIKLNRTAPPRVPHRRNTLSRWLPLIVIAGAAVVIVGTGWHRQLSLETLLRHRAVIDAFVAEHLAAAILVYIALYAAAVALSIPVATVLTICGGIVFGGLIGGLAAIAAATIGATTVFLIARHAIGGTLEDEGRARWGLSSGPLGNIAAGFRKDAFWYLVSIRLTPVIPFWLVNLVPAPCGVRLAPFMAATALGIVPASFAFAYFGAGLDSSIAAQRRVYEACITAGQADCRLDFDLAAAITPGLIGGLVALGVLALVPPLVRRVLAMRANRACAGDAKGGSPPA